MSTPSETSPAAGLLPPAFMYGDRTRSRRKVKAEAEKWAKCCCSALATRSGQLGTLFSYDARRTRHVGVGGVELPVYFSQHHRQLGVVGEQPLDLTGSDRGEALQDDRAFAPGKVRRIAGSLGGSRDRWVALLDDRVQADVW